jgi:hypothetical protein
MNSYFIFVGGAIALLGGVCLIQTLGKKGDETVWITRGRAIPVEAQDLRRFGKIVLLIGFVILLLSLILL